MNKLIQTLNNTNNLYERYMDLPKEKRALWDLAYKMLEIGYYNHGDFYKFLYANGLPMF